MACVIVLGWVRARVGVDDWIRTRRVRARRVRARRVRARVGGFWMLAALTRRVALLRIAARVGVAVDFFAVTLVTVSAHDAQVLW